MIREAELPWSREEAYRILMDPVSLVVWLGVSSVTTGPDPLHVFEAVETGGNQPWRVRGAIVERQSGRLLVIETDPDRKHPVEKFRIELDEAPSGCVIRLEWMPPRLNPLAEALLGPDGILRLSRVLQMTQSAPAPGAFSSNWN
jgi:hypothetical protein